MDRFTDPAELVDLLGEWSTRPGPLYRRLADAVKVAIRAGDIPVGERLPSERDLAKLLKVSRATVVGAYDQLRSGGVVESRRGSGTRVAPQPVRRRAGADGRVVGGRATSIFQRLIDGPGDLISLAFTGQAAAPELGEALRELVEHDLDDVLADVGYHPRGIPPLREAVADYYSAQGLETAPDQILVTTGAQQALSLVAQMYLPAGSCMVVEQPSWPGCLDVFRARDTRLLPVPLDEEGIRADLLSTALSENRPALVFVIPTYHNPTGTLMSAARRARVAEICARHEIPLVEDNAYSPYDSGGSRDSKPIPIAAYAPDRAEVLTVGSMAKSVWGGMRIGWIRAHGEIVERLVRYKARNDLASPVIEQVLATRLMPRLDEISANRSQSMSGQLSLLRELLTELLPEWRWRTPDGGCALWVELPDTDTRMFAQLALRHGIEVVPGAAADPSGGHDSFIRLPFVFPPDVLTEIVHRLRKAWVEMRRHGPDAPFRAIV